VNILLPVLHAGGRLFQPLALVAALAGCTETAAQPGPPPLPQVTVAPAVERDVTEWDEFTGRLEAVDAVEIRPRVSGYLAAVRFDEGAIVKRGDPLFLIDARPFEAEADRLRAELSRAEATVRRAGAELARAERLRAENAISDEEHGRRAAFAEESAAQVASVEAALRAAELNLEFTRVTSPIDGRVGRAIVTAGNLVSSGPGEATLLTTVVSLDPIYAYFDADEQFFLKYSADAGQRTRAGSRPSDLPIRMALASDTGFPRQGSTDFLDNQLDAATGTIRTRAVFRNTDQALTPGLFVRLRLAGSNAYRGLLIDDRAVGTDLGKQFVLTVDADSKVGYRTVTLGPLVDGMRVVRSGLEAGDRVIVNGVQRVRPGMQVEAALADPADAAKAAATADVKG
jgi:RND family efflux transporter MFP subunit